MKLKELPTGILDYITPDGRKRIAYNKALTAVSSALEPHLEKIQALTSGQEIELKQIHQEEYSDDPRGSYRKDTVATAMMTEEQQMSITIDSRFDEFISCPATSRRLGSRQTEQYHTITHEVIQVVHGDDGQIGIHHGRASKTETMHISDIWDTDQYLAVPTVVEGVAEQADVLNRLAEYLNLS